MVRPKADSTSDVASGVSRTSGQFTSGVNLVEVYVTVADAKGAPVTGLAREEFEVLEDGQAQRIDAFAAGEFPLAVAITIDRSASMTGEKLPLTKAAAQAFLGQLRPADQASVVAFGSEVDVVAPLSTDRGAQAAAVGRLDPWGVTRLHDAVLESLKTLGDARGRRALVLISDGIDRYSETRAADMLDRARRSDVLIYPIGIDKRRVPLFAELAAVTGGRSFHVRNPRDLVPTFSAIARELRHQYLLGYSPSRPIGDASEWRAIQVKVKRPGVGVRARDGYVATRGPAL
jgi:Ca-activated chloride channel family protein